MSSRNVFVILAIVVAIMYAAWFNARRTPDVRKEAREFRTHMLDVIHAQPWYAPNTKFFNQHLDLAEQAAYQVAFSEGISGHRPSFDKAAYISTFFKPLIGAAQNRGLKDVDFGLRDLQLKIEAAVAQGEPWWEPTPASMPAAPPAAGG